MQFIISGLILLVAVSFIPRSALADMPEATGKESPTVAAGRKAIESKDYKAALTHLTKAVEESPNDADAHNLLGYSYRNLGNFDKSMEHYQTALKLDPNHRSAHEYLGELYLDMNQLASAENQLQTLRRACPFFGRCAEYEDLKEAIDKYKAKK
jgi:Flp pilus assembly protein TadD